MLAAEDKKDIQKIVENTVLEVIKDVLMPTLQNMDEKSDRIDAKVDKLAERVGGLTKTVSGLTKTVSGLTKTIDRLTETVDSVDIKTDEIILNQKKDDKRIQRLEKSLTVS